MTSAMAETNATTAARLDHVPRGNSRSAAAVPSTYTRTNDPVVSKTDGRRPTPVSAVMPSATPASAAVTSNDRRGTSPTLLPRANQAGSAPSRPNAAPSRADPAKYAFIAPIDITTAATAVIPLTGPPTPMLSRSDSGAGLEPVAGPSTRMLADAPPR